MGESETAGRDRARLVDVAQLVLWSMRGLVQPNKPDRRDNPSNGILMSADYCSILLEQIADQPDRLFGRGSVMDEMRREIFEQGHPCLIGPQQNHGLLCLQCQGNF